MGDGEGRTDVWSYRSMQDIPLASFPGRVGTRLIYTWEDKHISSVTRPHHNVLTSCYILHLIT